MAVRNFARALAATLRFEGGYVHHPADPGGATNMGVTRAVLAEWDLLDPPGEPASALS